MSCGSQRLARRDLDRMPRRGLEIPNIIDVAGRGRRGDDSRFSWCRVGRRPITIWAKDSLRFETLEAAQAYLDRWDARWADTRQAPGRRHVRRGAAPPTAAARRTVSLLPVRAAHGASGQLYLGRRRLLQRAARLARPGGRRAVETRNAHP